MILQFITSSDDSGKHHISTISSWKTYASGNWHHVTFCRLAFHSILQTQTIEMATETKVDHISLRTKWNQVLSGQTKFWAWFLSSMRESTNPRDRSSTPVRLGALNGSKTANSGLLLRVKCCGLQTLPKRISTYLIWEQCNLLLDAQWLDCGWQLLPLAKTGISLHNLQMDPNPENENQSMQLPINLMKKRGTLTKKSTDSYRQNATTLGTQTWRPYGNYE